MMKTVFRTTCLLALGATLLQPANAEQARAAIDCTMAKHLAGHALTMIKGGASLDQTLGMFDQSQATQRIIKEVFNHQNDINNAEDAGRIGKQICLKNTAHS